MFKEIFSELDLTAFRVHVDSGFVGLEHYVTPAFIFRPAKASKKRPLSETERLCNKLLASVRVRVEHAIAKAKAFFSLRIENRLKQKSKLDETMALCIGLANFKTSLQLAAK